MDPFDFNPFRSFFDFRPVLPDPRVLIRPPDTRPSLYEAWASGYKWAVWRGHLVRIVACPAAAPGRFWVKKCGWGGFTQSVPMTDLCSPRVPNSRYFITLRRQ